MDVTDDGQMDRAFEATIARFSTADVLVNNAAMRSRDLFPPAGRRVTLETSDEDFLRPRRMRSASPNLDPGAHSHGPWRLRGAGGAE